MLCRRNTLISLCILCFSAVNARSQWINDTPDTVIRAYNSAFMLNGQTGWIGGEYGSILKTTDGGGSWHLQLSNPSWFNGIGEIRFVDSLNGFALGMNSWGQLIHKTTNGGATWSADSVTFKALTDSGYFPMSLRTVRSGDSSLVSILFNAVLGPGQTHTDVYCTRDLGKTWTLCKLPPIPNQKVWDVIFPSPSTELVLGNDSTYFSSDGGATWVSDSLNVPNAFYWLSLRFFNPDTGYMAGPTDGGGFTGPLTVAWTFDGGRTWSVDTNQAVYGATIGSIVFTSLERGFAVKWNQPSIFETTDGGTTWMEHKLAREIPPQDISSADGKTVVAAGAGGEIIVSNDSGATWVDLTPPQKISFTDVKYLAPDLVAATGNEDGLFISSDSLKTWVRHQMPSGLKVVIAFGDTLNCWIADDSSRIFYSNDLGLTWSFQNEQDVPAPPLYAIDFLNDSIGCAVGGGGYEISTTDGGATWKSQTIPSVDSLFGVFIASPTKSWAVGGRGTICCSSDGFKTWTRQASPTRDALRSVFFSDTLNGYILGDGGVILKTTDGGTTWTMVQSPASQLNAMKFVNMDDGWVAGNGGSIFNTNDGGTSWTSQPSGVSSNLKSLDFVDTSRGIVVSGDGTLLTTKNGGVTTGVENRNPPSPSTFLLKQNFPNPFNPSTVINYQLPANSHVTIRLYDVLGRLVATLVNEHESAGAHSVTFNASRLPSGVYFYRLQAGTSWITKKMMLLK